MMYQLDSFLRQSKKLSDQISEEKKEGPISEAME